MQELREALVHGKTSSDVYDMCDALARITTTYLQGKGDWGQDDERVLCGSFGKSYVTDAFIQFEFSIEEDFELLPVSVKGLVVECERANIECVVRDGTLLFRKCIVRDIPRNVGADIISSIQSDVLSFQTQNACAKNGVAIPHAIREQCLDDKFIDFAHAYVGTAMQSPFDWQVIRGQKDNKKKAGWLFMPASTEVKLTDIYALISILADGVMESYFQMSANFVAAIVIPIADAVLKKRRNPFSGMSKSYRADSSGKERKIEPHVESD